MTTLNRIFWGGYNTQKSYLPNLKANLQNKDKKTLKAELLGKITPKKFKWRLFLVAGMGFLAGSYAIFSPNVVSPALAYIYWPTDTGGEKGMIINLVTLAGSCIGMMLFGWLADVLGRSRLYGVELVIGIIATLGLTQVSAGFNQESMNAFAWIIWWRLVLGIAIGAEYPLSALIASEWSATHTRGTMLAAVFLMQPFGQFLAYIIGYGALQHITEHRLPNWIADDWASADPRIQNRGTAAIDAVWRCVVGVGGFPALLAIILRWTIPETPRYLIDVKEDLSGAAKATSIVFPDNKSSRQNSNPRSESGSLLVPRDNTSNLDREPPVGAGVSGLDRTSSNMRRRRNDNIELSPITGSISSRGAANGHLQVGERSSSNIHGDSAPLPDEVLDRQVTQSEKKKTGFWHEWNNEHKGKGFTRILVAISVCWFIMDVCFYGLGLDTPRTFAKIWGSRPSDVTHNATTNSSAIIYDWQAGLAKLDDNIYDALHGDATRALMMIPVSSLPGTIILLIFLNYIPRVTAMRWLFLFLAIIFLITGSTFTKVFDTRDHSLTQVFYAFALFILNLGPNTILFMLPAEIFPTKYRGTCYGIAAASGKLGAITIQLVHHYVGITDPRAGKMQLSIMLMCFAPLILIAAWVSWFWIPDVQHPQNPEVTLSYRKMMLRPPRSLEEITENPTKNQNFGFVEHIWGKQTEGEASNGTLPTHHLSL